MAGGGAAASALSSPWRTLLQRALEVNAHLKHSTFFQLVRFGRLFPSPFWGNRNIVSIDRFRPRWAAVAGRRIAPSYSGGSKNTVIRFRSIRMDEPTRLMRSRIAPSVRYAGTSLTLGNNSVSAEA